MNNMSQIQNPELLVPRIPNPEIECPECIKIKFIDGTDIHSGCFTYAELAKHLMWHNQKHDYGQSLQFFTYNIYKQLGRINLYTKWIDWEPLFLEVDWNTNENNSIYLMWKISIKNTCRNSPCFQCHIDRINREKQHDIMKAEFKKHGFFKLKSGRKVPLRDMNQNGF